MNRIIKGADLFCGAGGTSTGLMDAANDEEVRLDLTAINHWPTAIETHSKNHPKARHMCATIDQVNPRLLYKEGELDLLWASPECTNHSIARGGKPVNDQSRATAMCVVRWAEATLPKVILVENVKEFLDWGPLMRVKRRCKKTGKIKMVWIPDPKRKTELFHAWKTMLEAIGYKVEWRILCAADYGDPTTRRRLFIVCTRGRRKFVWPEPTHAPADRTSDLYTTYKPWRTAREIIDWSVPGRSIYGRKKPLAPKTMNRIMIGLQKYGLQPFIVPQHQGGRPVHPIDDPVATVTTNNGTGIARPFLVHLRGTGTADPVEEPLRTVAAGGNHIGVAQPFLVQTAHGNGGNPNADASRARPVTEPMPTVTGGRRGEWALCEPFIVGIDHASSDHVAPANAPLSAVTTKQRHAVCQPYIIRYQGSHEGRNDGDKRVHTPEEPLPTLDTSNRYGLVQPYLIKFYGSGVPASVDDPLDTVTTNDRFGLCEPVIVEIEGERFKVDILFRMLNPKELARAQGFPDEYQFSGNSEDIVKQIGNAVPRHLARALGRQAIKCL